MENNQKILDRLLRVGPTLNQKSGLKCAQMLDQALGAPSSSYPVIHVAGSNGKGSVVTKIAKALEISGYRVGVFTSPHLFHFQERIVVSGKPISIGEIASGLEKIFALDDVLKLNASFFEITTFLAFDYFRKMQVDVAVIETGIGGRLDATNIVHPILSIITSISREHVHLLGEDIELIAREKAGIIKANIPVVIGPKAKCQSIAEIAKQMNSPLYASHQISDFYDDENSAIAQLALQHLSSQFKISLESIQKALTVRPPCRFQKINNIVFDVAHNPQAIFSLIQALHAFFSINQKLRFLVGFSKDKEYDRCLELIANVATHIHLVQAEGLRAASLEELRFALKNQDPLFSSSHCSIEEGMNRGCIEALANDEILVVCGSFYIMAEAKKTLQDIYRT